MPCGQGWLIDRGAPFVGLRIALGVGLLHGLEEAETGAAIRTEGDLHVVGLTVEVREKEVAELVERGARIAAGKSERVGPVGDLAAGPVDAIQGESLEEAVPKLNVADNNDVVRVCRVDGDRGLRLVPRHVADIDIGTDAEVRGAERRGRRKRGDECEAGGYGQDD